MKAVILAVLYPVPKDEMSYVDFKNWGIFK